MATVTTEVEIYNMALAHLGSDKIDAVTDTSRRAKVMNTFYPTVRDSLLASHPWNFAMKRVELAKLSAAPLYEWDSQFQLPSDLLRVWDEDFVEGSDWVREGNVLLADEDEANINYIFRQEDVTKYSGPFVEALALKLAHAGCYAITQSRTLKNDLLGEFRISVAEARSFNGQESEGDEVEANDWANQRF